VPTTLGKGLKTFGKGFAERCTRHKPLGEKKVGKAFFAVSFVGHSAKPLPSVDRTLGKEK